jgi:hypothetical protein
VLLVELLLVEMVEPLVTKEMKEIPVEMVPQEEMESPVQQVRLVQMVPKGLR